LQEVFEIFHWNFSQKSMLFHVIPVSMWIMGRAPARSLDKSLLLCYNGISEAERQAYAMNPSAVPFRSSDKLSPLGVLGALLFSLAGGIVYYVLWSIGIIAALSGIICVLCAIKGYETLSRTSSKAGIAVSVAVSALVLILAWYYCSCADLHDYYTALYEAGKTDTLPTMADCLRYGYLTLPSTPGYFIDLLLSLAMSGLGCWGYVTRALRRQEVMEARRSEQERTMELARRQAEQAAQAMHASQAEKSTPPEQTSTNDSPADESGA
jgi:hypothetical protein